MSDPMSPATARLYELLADGDWHDRSKLLDEIAPLVEPGKAYRKGETRRQRNGARSGAVRMHGDHQTAIAAGARELAHNRIKSAIANGRIESRTVDGHVQIRAAR